MGRSRRARRLAIPIVDDPKAPLGQLPGTVTPVHYRLDLTIVPDRPRYSGVVEIDLNLEAPHKTIYLHGRELTVEGVTARLNDASTVNATYAQVHDSGVARLTFDRELPKGRVTLHLPFNAAFKSAPDALTSMTDSGNKYAWTQFESISARRAFPSFDEPRFKTPFDIAITTRKTDAVVTNTLPVKEEDAGNGLKKTVFATTAPLPTYLIAFAVGPYDVTTGPTIPPWKARTNAIPLRGITVDGKGDRVRYALEQTPMLVRYLEDYFAAPFPYPKLDLITPPNFSAGGMENAGAITYTERGILLDETASVQQKRYFTLLHAHEVAHQWFGDLVTPKWWNDIWLNESFATWMGNKASRRRLAARRVRPRHAARRARRDGLDSLSTARAIRQPIESNDDIANAFDGLTYDKGGGVLGCSNAISATTPSAKACAPICAASPTAPPTCAISWSRSPKAPASPKSCPPSKSFLNQPGVPLVRAKSTCSGPRSRRRDSRNRPSARRTSSDKRNWSVPVCMRDMTKGKRRSCTMLTPTHVDD